MDTRLLRDHLADRLSRQGATGIFNRSRMAEGQTTDHGFLATLKRLLFTRTAAASSLWPRSHAPIRR
jgi:hypothetical protein